MLKIYPEFSSLSEHYPFCRFLLVMPGALTNSYSKAMQFHSSLGSVVLLWENDAFEFYYHKLRDGVHYLSVNKFNLVDTVRVLRSNDTYAYSLASAMNQFVREHLRREDIAEYYHDLFLLYSVRQGFQPDEHMLNELALP
eukprot:gb/GECG01015731.1/.p1 GENE.gb/GECG01015731.1/~~gb/GECG01015731.1/.p1  ORF type:complete len:140 (+),score=8.06 gb/GECG01015731.1/:1-420(+)